MDIRIKVLQNVSNALCGKVENNIIELVNDLLTIELNNYELQERHTDLVEHDTSSEKILKKFLATKRIEGIADTTLHRYAKVNRELIDFIGKPLNEITTYDLRFYLSLRKQKGNISNRTLDGMRRCYSSFFSWLSAEGIINKNPCATLSRIKYKKDVKKPFSAIEMEKIRNSCDNIRDLAIIDFLYCTGCRVSEVSKLDISDIDFDHMECTVLGKGNKERIVYLTEVAAMHLQEYLNTRKDCLDALFVGKGNKRQRKNGIEALHKRLGKKANVENVHPHRYRRTLATNLLDRGMRIQDVAVILGHADLKTTQIYCYISQKNVENSYRKYIS